MWCKKKPLIDLLPINDDLSRTIDDVIEELCENLAVTCENFGVSGKAYWAIVKTVKNTIKGVNIE